MHSRDESTDVKRSIHVGDETMTRVSSFIVKRKYMSEYFHVSSYILRKPMYFVGFYGGERRLRGYTVREQMHAFALFEERKK